MVVIANNINQKYRLTIEQYHRMGEIGILKPQNRVELIEGVIVDQYPRGSIQAGTVMYISKALNTKVGDQAYLFVHSPIILNDLNELEPDIVLLKPRDDYYRHSHPTPKDIILIIEVAETSLRYDRDIKIPLYAKYNIPEVWLVDLENKQLTGYTMPTNNNYENIDIVSNYAQVSIKQLANVTVDITKLF